MLAAVASALLLMSSQSATGEGRPAAPLVITYETALRCAGLTQAASELRGGETAEGHALYDDALFWSLTTIQLTTAQGRSPTATEDDMQKARIGAVRRLSSAHDDTLRDLRRCRQQAPSLNGGTRSQ